MISVSTSTDASCIQNLVQRAWTGTVDPRSSGHRFRVADAELLLQRGTALVASDESGEALGSVIVVPGSNGTVEVMKLAVPTQRHRGIGTLLLHAAVKWARQSGASEIILAVSAFQPELVRYYARRGYVVRPDRIYAHAHPSSPDPIVMTFDLHADQSPPADSIAAAARALQEGHLVIIPTETVYGLGALATDPVAVRRVFATKGRPVDHPLIVHLASAKSIDRWAVRIPDSAHRLAAALWPGPLTIVLEKHPDVPDEVTGGLPTVALRVPNHPVALAVLGLLPEGAGIAAPSANRFGKVSPTSAADAAELLPFLVDGDLVVDGGPSRVGVESTIVDLTSAAPTILRPGGVSPEKIEEVLGCRVERIAKGPSRAPGMLASHYAPHAGVRLATTNDAPTLVAELLSTAGTVGLLAPNHVPAPPNVVRLAAPEPYDGENLAPLLYARLREADSLGVDVLVVVLPREEGLGWAVADRLRRAANTTSGNTTST